jgi:hypothetical protein
MRIKILLTSALLAAGPVLGQQIVRQPLVKSHLVKTSRANTLVVNGYENGHFNFRIELDPQANVKPTAKVGLYRVNGQDLYVKATPAAPFAAGRDTATLRRYAESEMRRLLANLPRPVKPYVRQFTDKTTGRQCLLWGFDMPEALDKSLDGVLYLYFLDGRHLLSINGTQLQDQPMKQALDILFGALQGYTSSAVPYPLPRQSK